MKMLSSPRVLLPSHPSPCKAHLRTALSLPPASHLSYLPFATAARERAAAGKVVAWRQVADTVGGYFERKQRPKRIRLHFSRDPILAVV